MSKLKFIPNPRGTNEVLYFDDFFISYNANPSIGDKSQLKQKALANNDIPMLELLDMIPDNFLDSDRNQEETALCKDGEFYILNGDYRKEYIEALEKSDNDFEFCLYSVFGKYSETNKSSWSGEIGREKTPDEVKDWLKQRKLI